MIPTKAYLRGNLLLTFLWLLVIPVWYLSNLRTSVAFVGAISIYANVAGHLAAYQAARTEMKQDEQSDALYELVKANPHMDEEKLTNND